MTATTQRSAPPGTRRPVTGSSPRLGSMGLAAVAIGMLAAATFRSGAFYIEVALGVVVLGVPLIVSGLRAGDDRRGLLVALAGAGLSLWWLVRAMDNSSPKSFFPLGASIVGFVAAFLAVRPLPPAGRSAAAKAFVGIGSVSAGFGLIAVLTRWSALATVNHESWRAATTLTYANAAGLLVGMALLVAPGIDSRPWMRRAAVEVCLAGLIASQSLAGVVAVGFGIAFVPLDRWREQHRALAAGALVGVATVATSVGTARPLWLVPVAVVVLAWGAHPAVPRRRLLGSGAVSTGVAAIAMLVLAVTLASSSHHLFGPESDRTSIPWRSATHDLHQIGVTGLGPQGIANSKSPVRISDNLLGNDYLQIGVDGGLVALVLLVGSVGAVGYAVRRRGIAGSGATGALVAFAVGGLLDYSWHVPAIGLAGGVVAGLASTPVGDRIHLLGRRGADWAAAPRRVPWVMAGTALVTVILAAGVPMAIDGSTRSPSLGAAGALPTLPTTGTDPTTVPPTPIPDAGPGPGQFLTPGGPDDTDPFILHEGGRYLLYTSQGATRRNVPVRIGTSLTSWSPAFDALPVLPAWADPGATWAPDVRKVKGGWALYFTALVHGISPATHCVGAAFGSSPVGPFTADDQPFVCQLDHRGTIDARTFVDTNGDLILDFKSEDNANPNVGGPDQNGRTAIWAQRLTPDGRHLVGNRAELLGPTQSWEGTIVEAPQMVNLQGNYWLFFSGGWFNTPGYGIGYAICKGPFGPCTDLSPAPLLGSSAQGAGPGESSVFVDQGRAFLLYNPWHANDPYPTPPRPVAIAEVLFGTNGPYLAKH